MKCIRTTQLKQNTKHDVETQNSISKIADITITPKLQGIQGIAKIPNIVGNNLLLH